MKKLLVLALSMGMAGAAFAKLPALSDEAKAKADEAKAKAAWNDKVAAYKLCLVQDRVAEAHFKKGGTTAKASGTAACQDPGPYVAAAPAASPVQAAAPAAAGTELAKK